MRVISKIKNIIRRSSALQALLLSPKWYFYVATGKGWITGWDDQPNFLHVPHPAVAFNKASRPFDKNNPMGFF